MNRIEWEFEYSASKLAVGAQVKLETHLRKLAWWEKKKAETMQKVRDSGIEIRDSVAASYYSNTKGGYGPQIEVDAGMQRDLSECQNKILEHNKLVEDYKCWIEVLSANPDSRHRLHHDDWLYFFGS